MVIVARLGADLRYPLSPLNLGQAFDLGLAECVEAVHECSADDGGFGRRARRTEDRDDRRGLLGGTSNGPAWQPKRGAVACLVAPKAA